MLLKRYFLFQQCYFLPLKMSKNTYFTVNGLQKTYFASYYFQRKFLKSETGRKFMGITIIEEGFAAMKIRLLPSAGRVEEFAAKELAWYLYRMSKSGICIEKSENSFNKEFFLVSEGKKEEEKDSFHLEAKEGKITLCGSNPRSVLFAVYEFLEHLGCAFSHPFDEFVPEKTTIAIENFSVDWKGDIAGRSIFQSYYLLQKEYHFDGFIPERRLPQIAYLAKNKFNTYIFSCDYDRLDLWDKFKYQILDALQERGLKIAFVSSTLQYFCPESADRDFGEYGKTTYVTEKPSWYHNGFLRIDLPEVQALIGERLCTYLLTHKEISSITFSPRKEMITTIFQPENRSLMDTWMLFFNSIAKYVAEKLPGRTLDVMLHHDLLSIGESKIKAEKNIHFIFRTDEKINIHYSFLAPENKELKHCFDLLAEKGYPLSLINGSGETSELNPYWKTAQEMYSYCKKKNVTAISEFAGHTYNMTGMNYRYCMDYFCCGNLMGNCDCDVEKVLEKWADGLFGASGKYVSAYYKEMAEEHSKCVAEKYYESKEKWLTLDSFRKIQHNFALAKEKISPEDQTGNAEKKMELLEIFAAKSVTNNSYEGFEKEDEFMR